jgi:hypothetical protein
LQLDSHGIAPALVPGVCLAVTERQPIEATIIVEIDSKKINY